MANKKLIFLYFIFVTLFLIINKGTVNATDVKYLNLYLGQNWARISSNKELQQGSGNYNKSPQFPSIDLELLRIANPEWKSPIKWISIDAGALLGLENNEFYKGNVSMIRLNLGMTSEYWKKLRYKEGTRSISFLLSSGVLFDELSDNNGSTFGLQAIIRFKTQEAATMYEPLYTKLFFYYDNLSNKTKQMRGGISLGLDVPYYVGTTLKITPQSAPNLKSMWRRRSFLSFITGLLVLGGGYYCNSAGDNYYDDYKNAENTQDALDAKDNTNKYYNYRNTCYYGSIVPFVYSLYSLIRSGRY